MAKNNENFFKNEGIAIFVKGNMALGIHPENLENNTRALNNGDMKIDWELLLARANGTETFDKDWWEKKGAHDLAKAYITVKNHKSHSYKVPKQIEEVGVSKETLFKSWVEELGYDKAVLLACNYDVKKVIEMSAEDAEAEVQAFD